jgi:hypothetical protein
MRNAIALFPRVKSESRQNGAREMIGLSNVAQLKCNAATDVKR